MQEAMSPTIATRPRPQFTLSDRAFNLVLGMAALGVMTLIVVIGSSLSYGAMPAVMHFGAKFLWGMDWDPVRENFGALPFIYGTLMSSLLALLLAVPIGLGTAIFLTQVAPRWLAQPLAFLVELLAAVPSVVYGMWGIFVVVPLMQHVMGFISERWGDFPLFSGPPIGIGLLTASIILAIMILPFIASIAKDSIQAVPRVQAEAGLALGATRWETMSGPVLRYARKGILGGVILALGRALGETMAVTMVIGNNPQITASLFRSAYSMSAVLANEFAEATGELHTAVLVYIALVLLGVTFTVNALARLLIWSAIGRTEGKES
jgi:phosphate transport system permease protein